VRRIQESYASGAFSYLCHLEGDQRVVGSQSRTSGRSKFGLKHVAMSACLAAVFISCVACSEFGRIAASLTRRAPQVVFHGVTLGESKAEVVKALGWPEIVLKSNHGSYYSYSVSAKHGWLAVLINHSNVESVNTFPQLGQQFDAADDAGVQIGSAIDDFPRDGYVRDTAAGMLERRDRGRVRMYGIVAGRVYSVGISKGSMNIPPMLLDWQIDGSSNERAITVQGSSVRRIWANEDRFVASQRCGASAGRWRVVARIETQPRRGRTELVRVRCSLDNIGFTYHFLSQIVAESNK